MPGSTPKKTARHGDWESPISLDLVTSGSKVLSQPRVSANGRIFFLETRTSGSRTIVQITGGTSSPSSTATRDILPVGYSAANSVYTYGGSAYDALPDDRLIFSNKDDSVNLLDPDTGEVTRLTGEPHLAYSNFSANNANPWVLAIQEDRKVPHPEGVVNRIVAIHVDTGRVKVVREGADFYYPPEYSRDGTRFAWLEWDHPDQPWYGARLYHAIIGTDAEPGPAHLVAGGLLHGVAEPRWGPDGSLFFGMETGNYRQLFRLRPGEKNVTQVTSSPDLADAEFGELVWFPGSHTYVPMSDKTLVTAAQWNGASRLIAIDLDDGSWRHLAPEEEANQVQYDCLARIDDSRLIGIFSGTLHTDTAWIVNLNNPQSNKIIRRSQEHQLSERWFAKPELLNIASKGKPKRTVHSFLWMPHNPKYQADTKTDALPPLIIATHGGPTGHWGPGLRLRTQYFTTRGYAVVLLNYHGSTCHGRAYRQALWSNWGRLDADDAVEVAEHLASTGRVRRGAVGCTGLSAGGYHTLSSITRHPTFYAGAVDVSGICDLASFNSGTHKLEWNYTDALVIADEGAAKKQKDAIYKERSALYHTDRIVTPLLILHAKQDMVVPMNQATGVYEALKEQEKDVRLVQVDDDGHSLAKPRSARIWLDEEEKWWRKTLLK